jgi:hypothetical protein
LDVQKAVPTTSRKDISSGGNGTYLFFSYSTGYFPLDSGAGAWILRPGEVNDELVKGSHDEAVLNDALWDTATLTAAAQLVDNKQAGERAKEIIQSMFIGDKALPPDFKYARVQPTRSKTVFRNNAEGFQVMDDVGLILLDEKTLPLGTEGRASFSTFFKYASLHS